MRRTLGLGLVAVLFLVGSGYAYGDGLVWEQKRIEKTAKVNEKSIDVVFPFRVEGRSATIKSIHNSCGCTTSKLAKQTYAPGESGEIQVHFEIGARVGEQHKYITLKTDDPDNPTTDLELLVYIPHIAKFEPRFIYWSKGQEAFEPQSMLLKIDADIPVELKSVTTDQGQLKASWEKSGEKEYRITLTPVIPEGEEPFFRAIIKAEIEASVPLKQTTFYAYAFVKSS